MATKHAFGLLGFDSERILSRNFFKEYHFKQGLDDTEILGADEWGCLYDFETLNSMDNETLVAVLDDLKASRDKAMRLVADIRQYANLLSKHMTRLEEVIFRLQKSALVTDDVAIVKAKYQRAATLQGVYSKAERAVVRLVEDIGCGINLAREQIDAVRKKIFARKLKARRRELRLTQTQVANRAGITFASVVAYEREKREPPILICLRLAEALEIKIEELTVI